MLANAARLDGIELTFVAGIHAADVEARAVVVGAEGKLGVFRFHAQRREAGIGRHDVAKRHAIVVGAENPLHRTHGARARHHVDADLIEAVAGFGCLGRHQLVHLVDAARPDLARTSTLETSPRPAARAAPTRRSPSRPCARWNTRAAPRRPARCGPRCACPAIARSPAASAKTRTRSNSRPAAAAMICFLTQRPLDELGNFQPVDELLRPVRDRARLAWRAARSRARRDRRGAAPRALSLRAASERCCVRPATISGRSSLPHSSHIGGVSRHRSSDRARCPDTPAPRNPASTRHDRSDPSPLRRRASARVGAERHELPAGREAHGAYLLRIRRPVGARAHGADRTLDDR